MSINNYTNNSLFHFATFPLHQTQIVLISILVYKESIYSHLNMKDIRIDLSTIM